MNNREWLYSLDVADLADWFDAEHDEGLMDLDSCTHGVRTFASETDSREKLEADVRQILHSAYMLAWMHGNENRRGSSFKKLHTEFYNLLDRQAAITERELCKQCDWPSLAAQPDFESQKRITELAAQVYELMQQLINARADCEQYRELLSEAIRYAHEIVNLQP